MALELNEDAAGAVSNACTLCEAADLAYYGEAEAVPGFKDKLGLDARLLSHGNTQCFIATNDKNIVVAFRGTESPTSLDGFKDTFLTDAVNLLILPEGRLGTDLAAAGVGARFHQGFVNALAEIWPPVLEGVEAEIKKQDRPLWITGHSLGGALALLSGWLFHRKFISVHEIITFGAPMIGNTEAVAAFDREFAGKIFRYVNDLDPVPKLPTLSLLANDYGHCMKEIVLGAAQAAGDAAATSAGLFQSMVKNTVDGVLKGTLIDDFWNQIKQRLGSHALTKYRRFIDDMNSKG